jgi:hypothetical protein
VRSHPATLTDLERAAAFFYLQKTAFGGKVAGRNFGVSLSEGAAFDVTRIVPELEAFHDILMPLAWSVTKEQAFALISRSAMSRFGPRQPSASRWRFVR